MLSLVLFIIIVIIIMISIIINIANLTMAGPISVRRMNLPDKSITWSTWIYETDIILQHAHSLKSAGDTRFTSRVESGRTHVYGPSMTWHSEVLYCPINLASFVPGDGE